MIYLCRYNVYACLYLFLVFYCICICSYCVPHNTEERTFIPLYTEYCIWRE